MAEGSEVKGEQNPCGARLGFSGPLPLSLFAGSETFFDQSKACSRCFQNSPFGPNG